MKNILIFIMFQIIFIRIAGQDLILQPPPDTPTFNQTESENFISFAKTNNSTGDILFPNAFKWNGSGSTGGYWNENQSDDHTFRPIFNNVANYKLRIYTRWGVLIYESSDLYKGWDGYSRSGSLAQQGVYVWIATGKFNDGTSFSKLGDVTFLH